MVFNQLKWPASLQKGLIFIWGLTVIVFLISLIFFCYFFLKIPLLHDGDSYYHLAVARLYAEQGFVDQLPWVRYSAMHNGFGDKEFLFHVLLMPFVSWLPSELGGKLALALLNAMTVAVIANLSIRSIGRWGIFVPVWIFGTSAAFTLRMSRLRPEILSLQILIFATWLASQKKYRWVILLAALYALSYTAVHVLIGLCVGWFVVIWWVEKRWEWRLPMSVAIGSVIGLVIHPHFPSNLNIWVIQNIDFFLMKSQLDVGNEIQSSSIATILSLNLGWLLGLVVFWRSTVKNHAASKTTGTEIFFLVNALAFSLLYLLMQRFSTYCVPFVTLALLLYINSRNLKISQWTYFPWHGKLPFAATFGLCLCTGILSAWHVYVNLSDHSVFDTTHRQDWQALGQVIPKGAKVAAPWDATEVYVWAAPQAHYLNLLDPVFMAVPYPSAYLLQKNIWNGDEPDVPYTVKTHFDSDYIVFPFKRHIQLYWRLLHDPRAKLLYRGHTALFRLKPDQDQKFMVNWKIIPDNRKWPPDESDINEMGISYPEQKDSIAQDYKRYVNGSQRNSSQGCINLAHIEDVDEPVNLNYEISSYGSSSVWLNHKLLIKNLFPGRARLGQGVRLSLQLEKGRHIFSVQTCPYKGRNGFYFLERSRSRLN